MPNDLWTQLAANAGLTLTGPQLDSLARYIDLLLDANTRMNLTRITDRDAAEIQHVGDALTLLPFLPAQPSRIADVGSGGGVPGLPLAIARPDCELLLIESTRKKAAFLKETAQALQLSNVSVIDQRAEAAGRGQLRESCDIAVARAVGELAWLAEWCLPLIKPGGKMLAMKGARVTEELPAAQKAIKLLGGGPAQVHAVELPGAQHHVIVEIPKTARTDMRYPRDPTVAKGKAL